LANDLLPYFVQGFPTPIQREGVADFQIAPRIPEALLPILVVKTDSMEQFFKLRDQ